MKRALLVALVLVAHGCAEVFEIGSIQESEDQTGDQDNLNEPSMADAPAALKCPGDYLAIGASRFKIVDVATDWNGAAGACDALVTGGYTHLAVFSADSERQAVSATAHGTYWIGLSNQRTAAVYRWNTGETGNVVGSPAWASAQPAGSGCVVMDGGTWATTPCADELSYICECDEHANDLSQYQ